MTTLRLRQDGTYEEVGEYNPLPVAVIPDPNVIIPVRTVQPFDTGWVDIKSIVTASIYTAGDVVGDPILFSGLPKAGLIDTVLVLDEDKEEISSNLVLFDDVPTDVADHDIFVVAAVDYSKQIGDIPVTAADYSTYSGSSFATVNNIAQLFIAPAGRLTVYWVTRGTPTIAAEKRLWLRLLGYGI